MKKNIHNMIKQQEFKDNQKFAKKISKVRRIQQNDGKTFTEVKRIPSSQIFLLDRIGDGNYRKGLDIALSKYFSTFVCPECGHKTELDEFNILMSDCNLMMYHLEKFYGSNHYKHFCNFPAFFRKFLNTGQCDKKFFEEDKEEK